MGETKEKSQVIDFLGGFFGGVASTYIGHPLDTVKVRMQVSQISSTTTQFFHTVTPIEISR